MKQQTSSSEGVRQRVNRCLTKLSDRDTEAMAAAELDSIALSLTAGSIATFISALSDARPSDKTPLRRHPLRLLSLVSSRQPPSLLLPHLPRMLSAALLRLRDPDSSVRSALVDAVRSISAADPPSLPSLLRPLSDALLHEQDANSQSAAALALAAAVSAPGASATAAADLQRLLPRLVKLARSNSFKAKPSLISLLGAVAAAGGAATLALVGLLVPCLVDFLAGDDWAARKAAAEALEQVALSERDLLGGLRSGCLSTFESRRFDKVKIVRDSMNRMMDAWKDIPGDLGDDSAKSNSSLIDTPTDAQFRTDSVNSSSVKSDSPFIERKNRFSAKTDSPSPATDTRKNTSTSSKTRPSRSLFGKTSQIGSDWKVEVSVTQMRSAVVSEEELMKDQSQGGVKSTVGAKSEVRQINVEKNWEEKKAARVVPLENTRSLESTDELDEYQKDGDLSTIQMQLLQIENQQSDMLDLIQKFIGSSQNGIHSLETRVNVLEMVLDDISHELAASSGRLSNNDFAANTCCRLPGADFLTSKFWGRTGGTQGRDSSRFPVSDNQTLVDMHGFAGQQGQESYRWDKQRFGLQGRHALNPLAESNHWSRGSAEITSGKMFKSIANYTGFRHTQDV